MESENSEKKWYEEKGLHFSCTGCGKCCTGSPGYVWVNEEEMQEIASFLNLTFKEFTKRYVRKVSGRYSLVERKKNYDCIFLEGKKCLIYAARPTQCRTYPWWPENVKSPEAWELTARSCEGISSEAPLVPVEEIEANRLIQIKRSGNSR